MNRFSSARRRHHQPPPPLQDQALAMHIEGLSRVVLLFGPESLVTAKYYGNLGRLLQTQGIFDGVCKILALSFGGWKDSGNGGWL